MIAHLVIFRPRPNLTPAEQDRLTKAFAMALRDIPSIRRARVGRRVTHGRPYEALMRVDYSHAAILEFDDLEGLKAYLQHPSHDDLGRLFFEAFEDVLIYDFDLQDGATLA